MNLWTLTARYQIIEVTWQKSENLVKRNALNSRRTILRKKNWKLIQRFVGGNQGECLTKYWTH